MDALVTSARGRRLLFFTLYLSEGGPIGLLWWALPAHLRLLGLPLTSITLLTSLLVLPWTLKFLWSPLIDTSRARGTPLRVWIGCAQLAMAGTLLPLLFIDFQQEFHLLLVVLLVHAVAAATQDAAIDAYAIRKVALRERGALNAYMQAGMLLGRGAFGGSTLILITALGFGGAVVALALLVASIGLFVLGSTDHAPPIRDRSQEGMRTTLRSMWHVLWEPSGRAGMLVALVAGAGFEGVGAVAGPFLVDRGYSATTIGLFFAFGTTPAMVLGAFLGGAWADRQDRASVTRNGVVLIAAVVLLVMLADGWEAPGGMFRMLLLGLLYFTIGIYTASSYALFMDLTHPQIGATQFSAYMAGTNLCEGWSAFAVGRLASVFGYLLAFGVLAGASLLSLPLFRTIRAGLGQRLLPDPRD